MSKVLSLGFTDTPIEGVTSLDFPRGLINYGADFRIKQSANNEVILTNLTCPTDQPEKFRIGYQEIADVYTNTGIQTSVQAPYKRGIKLLVQLTQVASITDDTDADFRIDAPISVQLIVKVPSIQEVTEEIILQSIGRLMSGIFETGSTTSTRLRSEFRGALVPTDL